MNFKRIQWIFLVVFIAIDFFLAYSYISTNNFTISSSSSSRETSILNEMKQDSITGDKLSTKESSGYYISSTGSGGIQSKLSSLKDQEAHYSDGTVTSYLNSPLTVNAKHPQKQLNKFVHNKVAFGSSYTYDAELSAQGQNTVVYVQKAAGMNVYSGDGEIQFKVNSRNQVISYTQSFLGNIKTLHERTNTVSERKAVIWLYQHDDLPSNSTIKWSKLGYTKLLSLSGDNAVYIPTWLIAVEPNNSDTIEVKKVNAFTGTLIKSDVGTIDSSSSSSSSSN